MWLLFLPGDWELLSLGVRVGAVVASTVLIAASVWLERGETGQAMFSSLTTVGD